MLAVSRYTSYPVLCENSAEAGSLTIPVHAVGRKMAAA